MNQFKIISLASVFFALSLSNPAQAASASSSIQWGVSGPFALIDGTAYFGAFFTGDYFVTKDISVGGQTGFLIGSTNSITVWDLPIQATGKYHFAISGASSLHPYVGLGLGIGILHAGGGTATINNIPVAAVGSSTSAKFQGEIKLGAAFQEGPGLMAEIRLGLVDSSFLFAPSIGYNF